MLTILFNVLLLLGGLAALIAGAEVLVRASSALAIRLGLMPLVIGLTVVAFGTSTPELAVSIQAASQGNGGMVMGNIIGSNIANIGLILGTVAIISPIKVHPQLLRIDIPILLLSSLLLYILCINDELTRLSGLVLFGLLLLYTSWSLYHTRQLEKAGFSATETITPVAKSRIDINLLLIAIGLVLLILGARWLVDASIAIAELAGVSKAIIALTVIAVGTSLPELATSLVAAYRRQTDIAIGNVIGSNIFNLLGITGITALIQPFNIRDISQIDWLTMLIMPVILWLFINRRRQIGRVQGSFLLSIYGLYIIYLFSRIM